MRVREREGESRWTGAGRGNDGIRFVLRPRSMPVLRAGTVYTKPRGSYPFNNAITYQFHANAVPENPWGRHALRPDRTREIALPAPHDPGKWPRIINVGLRSSGMINGVPAPPRIITLSSQISAHAYSVFAPLFVIERSFIEPHQDAEYGGLKRRLMKRLFLANTLLSNECTCTVVRFENSYLAAWIFRRVEL